MYLVGGHFTTHNFSFTRVGVLKNVMLVPTRVLSFESLSD